MRSGSSFVGQLFNQHSDVFYLFEPLYHVDRTLITPLSDSKDIDVQRVMLGASRDLLRSLWDCDLYFLETYIKPQSVNHTTDNLFRRGASKALCSPPVCKAFSPGMANIEEGVCTKKYGLLNVTLAVDSCRDRHYIAFKTVRIPEINDLRGLVEDPRLNLKIIQLFRDPRGILSSRLDTFKETFRLWRIWRATGRKPYKLDLSQQKSLCEDLLNTISTGLSRPDWLKGKYMLVRYEDVARNPIQKTKEIFEFVGMSLDKNVVNWIKKNTMVSNKLSTKNTFGTKRDSAANAESWRLKVTFEMVKYTQNICQQVLHQLGYKDVNSSEELNNMSLTLIEDRTFVPFL